MLSRRFNFAYREKDSEVEWRCTCGGTHNEVRFAAVPLSGDRADSALRRDIPGGALECVIRDEGFNGKCSGPVAAN